MVTSFQEKVENQFDYLCKLVIKYERIGYMRQIYRRSEKEIPFSDVGEYVEKKLVSHDNQPVDYHVLSVLNQSIRIKDTLLYKALKNLPYKKRKIILLYYFLDMKDWQIATILNLHTSTVNRHRQNSLKLLRNYMEAYKDEV